MRITSFRKWILFLGDLFCLTIGLFAALAMRYGFPIALNQLEAHQTPFFFIFVLWLLVFYSGGLYNLQHAKNQRNFFTLFFTCVGVNSGLAVVFFYFIPYFAISPKTLLFLDLFITTVFLILWRALFNSRVSLPPLRLAIIGAGREGEELINDITKHPQHGFQCVLHVNYEKALNELPLLLKKKNIDVVVVRTDGCNILEAQKKIFDCIPLHIQFFSFVDFYEQYFQKVPLAIIDRIWFLENFNEPGKQLFSFLKRLFDIMMALFLSVIGLIFFPFIAVVLLIDPGRPIFFSQVRVGQFGKQFRIFKFRTYSRENDEKSIFPFGRLLRKAHLDEIPQLWNILKGDMSFVGPRPEQGVLVEELMTKTPFYSERLLVRPGITGWAQLHKPHARAEDAFQKLQYDLFYIKHRSILFDIEIILKTLRILLH